MIPPLPTTKLEKLKHSKDEDQARRDRMTIGLSNHMNVHLKLTFGYMCIYMCILQYDRSRQDMFHVRKDIAQCLCKAVPRIAVHDSRNPDSPTYIARI